MRQMYAQNKIKIEFRNYENLENKAYLTLSLQKKTMLHYLYSFFNVFDRFRLRTVKDCYLHNLTLSLHFLSTFSVKITCQGVYLRAEQPRQAELKSRRATNLGTEQPCKECRTTNLRT